MKRQDFVDKFVEEMLPRNYAITKSMEQTRLQTSGTFWYMKKYIVLYNYIFLNDKTIETNEYISKCIECFDNFINSLDETVKDDAYEFFYPNENKINMKSEGFVSFNSFVDHSIEYENSMEKKAEIESAKKYYFAFLMQVGGQNGVKHEIKVRLFQDNFRYSIEAIKNIIRHFDPEKDESEVNGLFNDYHASLRNERQILFYYGYFHGKSSFANNIEFSSLTPVGELALIANYEEFLCIWETQKLKMQSQTVLTEIVKVNGINTVRKRIDPENFGVSYNPYIDILDFLHKHKEISLDVYQYIISRNRNYYVDDLIDNSEELIDSIEIIKNRVKSFDTNDQVRDDFDKELKKFILGLRSDLPKDRGTNPFGCLELKKTERKLVITNESVFNKIYQAYKNIRYYKNSLYINDYRDYEREVKRQYVSSVKNEQYIRDSRLKIEWDMYNLKTDVNLLLYVMLIYISVCDEKVLERNNSDIFYVYMNSHFSNVMKKLGMNVGLKNKIKQIITAFNSCNFVSLVKEQFDEYDSVADNSVANNAEDLMSKIKSLSSLPSVYNEGIRQRKRTLILQMKAYYESQFSGGGTSLLKCECCGNETFITSTNETYLEFHHLIPFSDEGPDHYLNLFALCPNCHRKIHFMKLSDKKTYYKLLNNNNYLQHSFVDRLIELKKDQMLKSYQLEYLLVEHAIDENDFDRIVS